MFLVGCRSNPLSRHDRAQVRITPIPILVILVLDTRIFLQLSSGLREILASSARMTGGCGAAIGKIFCMRGFDRPSARP